MGAYLYMALPRQSGVFPGLVMALRLPAAAGKIGGNFGGGVGSSHEALGGLLVGALHPARQSRTF